MMNIDNEALIMQSLHTPLPPSYAHISSISPYSQTPSVYVVGVLYRGFLPGRAEEDNEKARLKITNVPSEIRTRKLQYVGIELPLLTCALCTVVRSVG